MPKAPSSPTKPDTKSTAAESSTAEKTSAKSEKSVAKATDKPAKAPKKTATNGKADANGEPKKPAKGTKKSAKKGAKKSAPPKAPREVLYDKIQTKLCVGDKAITVEQMKKLVGYAEAPEGVKEGTYLVAGKRVFLTNNVTNRPIYGSTVATLSQELLRGKWKFNGEAMIVGKTGLILNGQHCALSLIEAEHERSLHPDKYREYWSGPITMDKLIVFGVDEGDDTVNTMDTCKPRTLADVLYRSEHFAALKTKDRMACAKICDYAVRMLWYRTGAAAAMAAFSPKAIRTHAESLDFIARHPRLLESVRHIYDENGGGEGETKNKIGQYLSLGYSSALLYLMGASLTEREKPETKDGYSEVANPSEEQIDFSMWDKAQEFFVLLASSHPSLAPVKQTLQSLLDVQKGSAHERMGILCNAWNAWSAGEKVTAEALELKWETIEDVERLAVYPMVGGIDLGRSADSA